MMSKLKLTGIVLAAVLLAVALAAKTLPGIGPAVMLPIMTAVLAVLTVTDFIGFKKESAKNGPARAAVVIRAISLTVITVIMLVSTVLYFVF